MPIIKHLTYTHHNYLPTIITHSHSLIFLTQDSLYTSATPIRHQKHTNTPFIPLYHVSTPISVAASLLNPTQQLNFIIRLLDMRKSAQSPTTKTHPQKVVYKLTAPTLMKFRPERTPEDPSSATLIGRIKSLSKYFSRQDKSRADSLRKSTESVSGGQGGRGTLGEKEGLQFLFRMDAETFLIGNARQLDAIGVSTVDDYVESEQLWSLRGNSPFLQLLVDDRRKTLVAVLQGQIEVYAYEGRRSKIPPKLLKSLRAVGQVRALQLARDLLLVFFEEAVHAYVLDGAASRQTSRKEYKVERSLKLLQVGQCVDGVLPLFFSKPSSGGRVQLYCLPVEIVGERVGVGQLGKVYEVDGKQLQGLRVESVARDAFLMNLGQEILMFRKGYLVQRVKITQKVEGTHLKYFGDRVLVHVSTCQLDFYEVAIDLSATPPKLALQSFDCVTLPPLPHYSFLDAVRLDPHRLAFFYHLPRSNSSGERKYAFALTLPWQFEEKVASLLPRIADYAGKYEGPQFSRLLEEIAVGCDLVGKMGVSRKQAYLRVWRQSKKQQVEEFKLLLDTLDYATVREEILLKLRKKAMLFNEVHKVQAGCLGMLAQSLFGPRHTQDDLKNYLISHFLLRKLELFRDLRLYARKVGKVKTQQGEKKDKLFMDIQDYSTTVQMDIKGYILQLVYSLVKHRKDVATEIRLVLRKFRFPLRFVYEALLKDIVLTAKDDLLFLLKTIPQLLPLAPPSLPDPEEVALRSGVWGTASEEEWEAALHIQTVATIYNRQLVGQFGNSIWVKRYWLTQHDMLFHSRSAIQAERARTEGGNLFYGFLQVLFEQIGGQSAKDVVSFLEETYVELPSHLFNNVLLYRALFEYLKSSVGLEEGFAGWLRRSDQEIFKRLFQLQKARKGSLLREVKPIYQGLRQGDKFNLGLLRYFSSGVSEVSDIKYLLNRINNEKREFHDENIEMYQVLVKGMQIKLKLGSTHDIPISQVLIYINNIPLAHDHAVSHELALLQAINKHTQRFQHMRLDMSVFQIIRNRHAVLMATVAYQLQQAHMGPNENELKEKSARILEDLSGLRASIYGPQQDNELLFIMLAKLAERQELIPFLSQIAAHCAHPDSPFQQTDLESLVFYCYRRQLTAYPVYVQSKGYLQVLISLLPQGNALKMFISSEVQMALLFSQGQQQVKFPLCGDTGLITTHHIEARMHALPTQSLQALNVERVWELASILQRTVGGSTISLSALHQVHFCALLRRGVLHRALNSIASMITVQPEEPSNIIYPLMVFRRIACEFTEENKTLMVTLLGLLFRKPNELLFVLQHLMGQSFSNQDKKMFLSQSIAKHVLPPKQRFKMDNPLFNDDFLLYLQTHPQSAQKVGQILQLQIEHMLRCSEDWARSQDIPIYHLLVMHNPLLLLRYLHLSGSAISLKEARCFLSHLCKYPAYDPLKTLQFGKRIFKAMHDLHRKDGQQLPQLTADLLSSPLVEGRSIEVLDASTDNLAKLSKCVQKVKAKLKYKMASSSIMKRRSITGFNLPSKQQQIIDFLSDSHKYFEKCDYPFNDSDSYIERKECLGEEHIVVAEAHPFLPKKYLAWVLGRKEQSIDYFLLKTKEEEADQVVRQQEQALKLSFRTAPNDKFFKPYANVVAKTYQRIVQPGKDLGMLTESAIPAVPSSAISLKDIFPQVVQQVSLGASMLKDDILRSIRIEEDRLCFDNKLIQQFGTTQQIEAVLPDLLREIYHEPSLQYATTIALLREIHQSFPKLSPMSALWVQAYSKVDHMQRKLGLTLEPRVILPFQGLLVKEKDAGAVLSVVKQALQGQLNDNNIHTLSRVLALAFQKPQFQQHIINDYFGIILQEYSQLDNQLDQAMKLQKIMAFAKKMPLGQLKIQVQRTLSAMDDPSKQRRVVKAISDILRQRNDTKNADLLQSKWLQKPFSPRNGNE